ncbi:MAG: hypothetical protein ACREBS_03235 [Nitrososphaerales archaeon]
MSTKTDENQRDVSLQVSKKQDTLVYRSESPSTDDSNDAEFKEALDNYLLAEPERQIAQLGGVESLMLNARKEQGSGDLHSARRDYEYAARIEIYTQNKEGALKSLLLAEEVTDKDEDRRMHRIIMDRMDEVLRISAEYQSKNLKDESKEEEDERENEERENEMQAREDLDREPPAVGYPGNTPNPPQHY